MATPIVTDRAPASPFTPPVFKVSIVCVGNDANVILEDDGGDTLDLQSFDAEQVAAAKRLGVSLEAVARLRYVGRRLGIVGDV